MSSETTRIDLPPKRSAARPRKSGGGSAAVWQFTSLVWVIHWLLTQVPATLTYRFGSIRTMRENPPRSGTYVPDWGPDSGAYGIELPTLDGLLGMAHALVEPFRNWDGTWYVLVADGGYTASFNATPAFWPLYPWLMRLGSNLTGLAPEIIGYVISNVAFFFALWFLYKLVTLDFNTSVAEKTLWAVALFPTAFFFTAVYTESLFFLLAVAGLFYARRGEWLLAGLIGLLAALTRSAGMMLLAPYLVLFLKQYSFNPRRWFPQGFAAALPLLGPAIFGWHLRRQGFDFLSWMDTQWQWNRFSANPWRTLDCTVNGCTAEVRFISGQTGESYVHPIDWGWIGSIFDNLNWTYLTSSEFRFRAGESHVLELLITLLAFALVLIGLRKVPLYYTAFVVPPLLVPLFTPSSVNPLMSMPRFVLPLFPLFVVAVLVITNRRLSWILAGISSVLLVLLTMQFSLWYWVS